MKCRIYKLTSTHTDMVYVGSTVLTLNRRLGRHRCQYRAGRGCTSSCELFKFGEHDVKIELLEEIEIEHTRDPKRKRCEQKWMDCTENICNILRAEPASRKEYDKKYWQEHKAAILERWSERITCECGSVVSRGHISAHKKTEKHRKLMAPKTLIKVNIKPKSVE